MEIFGLQYKALLTSARAETHLLENELNARVISRIGFVGQDIKNFENEISQEIQNRSTQISNPNADCIIEAQRSLEISFTNAGKTISTIAQGIMEDVNILNEIAMHPVYEELEFLISMFEVEILNVFAYTNSVTSMFTLLIILESEIRTYGALFEYFVNEIYVDMVIFGMLSNEMNAIAFPKLNEVVDGFRTSGSSIINSLVDCN